MRILVTGATGYIGGRLIPTLLEAGHTVRCFARDPGRIEGRFPGAEVAKGISSMRRPSPTHFATAMSHKRVAAIRGTPHDVGGTCLRQTAFFDPRGAFGFAYWYAVLGFHEIIFNNMAKRIVLEAEQTTA
jgi:nucleoside-diphosphate-sugar epimerase